MIESGLGPDERFIVNGLQRVKPGDTVQAKLVEAPSPGGAEGKTKAMVTDNTERNASAARQTAAQKDEGPGKAEPR